MLRLVPQFARLLLLSISGNPPQNPELKSQFFNFVEAIYGYGITDSICRPMNRLLFQMKEHLSNLTNLSNNSLYLIPNVINFNNRKCNVFEMDGILFIETNTHLLINLLILKA
ncbi:hypothetical protein RchiOBHm_Chr6g0278681 [Rosa chinensis]|uniref:Uncharacterized protein n=1 Tax=Rosa chinensis TaxID=74649 RepID=A0A2P6PST9_ROSCH|nr:hypothetical protein RchiOBHm_Chr6g0278681 [Rosa chinensis]